MRYMTDKDYRDENTVWIEMGEDTLELSRSEVLEILEGFDQTED